MVCRNGGGDFESIPVFGYNNRRFGYNRFFRWEEFCIKISNMKIVVTGSLGHISKPLTETLVQNGHSVTAISSNPDKQKDIEALGAKAAIGSVQDVEFLTATFTGADAVYAMVPPANYFDPNLDLEAFIVGIAHAYADAIRRSGVKRVVHLSSIGAHMESGSGIILYHRAVELILDTLPGVAVTHMRPTSFYYNLDAYAGMIKNTGMMAANYGADDRVVWVSPVDIAAAVAEELETLLPAGATRKVRYVASDEHTCNEVAGALGAAIGKPDLKWALTTNEQSQQALEGIGMHPDRAAGLVEMYDALHRGVFFEDYYRNRPAVMGKVKVEDFAKEFAARFNA